MTKEMPTFHQLLQPVKWLLYLIFLFTIPYITIPVSLIYLGVRYCKKKKLEDANNPIKIAEREEKRKLIEKEAEYRRLFQQRVTEAEQRAANMPVECPKCHSQQVAPINQKSFFSFGKAAVGGVLVGGIGTLAGFIGSNKPKIMCMKCGHTWHP